MKVRIGCCRVVRWDDDRVECLGFGDMKTVATPGTRPVDLELLDRTLRIRWGDGHRSVFHYIWLRDACRCPGCGEPSFGDKRIVLSELPRDLKPMSAHLGNAGELVVRWAPDGHESRYSGGWLRRHCYSRSERERRRYRPTLWHGGEQPDLSRFHLPSVRESDELRYQVLERLHRYGLAIFTDASPDTGVEHAASLFGYLRETNYGRVSDIKVEPVARTFADLPQSAPLHTDDAFRVFPPGFIILHAVQPSADGAGASLFLDGFEVMRRLREQRPSAIELLARAPIRFSRLHPGEDDFVLHGKMLRLDPEGEVSAVRLGLHNISPPDLDEEDVEPFYDALRRVDKMVRDPELRIVRRLEAGELVLLDNERVLHGRESFDGSGGRHIKNGFVDRDAFHSTWRVLCERLGYDEPKHWVFPGVR